MRSVSRRSVRSWRSTSKSTAGKGPVAIVSDTKTAVGFFLINVYQIHW